jgi:hypothetical protein
MTAPGLFSATAPLTMTESLSAAFTDSNRLLSVLVAGASLALAVAGDSGGSTLSIPTGSFCWIGCPLLCGIDPFKPKN